MLTHSWWAKLKYLIRIHKGENYCLVSEMKKKMLRKKHHSPPPPPPPPAEWPAPYFQRYSHGLTEGRA